MKTSTSKLCKPVALLLVFCSGLGLAGLACSGDGNSLSDIPLVRELVKGDMRIFKVGHHASLHMSLKSSTRETGAAYSSPVADNLVNEHGLRLSYKLNW